ARPGPAGRWPAQPAAPRRADEQPGPAVEGGRGPGLGGVARLARDRQPRSGVRRGHGTRPRPVHARRHARPLERGAARPGRARLGGPRIVNQIDDLPRTWQDHRSMADPDLTRLLLEAHRTLAGEVV